jgi:hypothetical protein
LYRTSNNYFAWQQNAQVNLSISALKVSLLSVAHVVHASFLALLQAVVIAYTRRVKV